MSFINLLRREVYWLLKSPALNWSLIPLLVMIHLIPTLFWDRLGLDVREAEGMWGSLSFSWSFMIKSQIEQNMIAAQLMAPYLPVMDEILRLPAKDLWPKYIVPTLQAYSVLPLGTVIPPLAVSLLRRDLDHGAYRQLTMNGTSCLGFLFSKLLVLSLYGCLLNLLALGITLNLYQEIPKRGDYFQMLTSPWMLSHLVAIGFGAWVSIVSWWGCLGSKNGCSEIYTASVIGGTGVMAIVVAFYEMGTSEEFMMSLGLGLLFTTPIGLILLWLRMRQSSFLLNR